MSDKDLYLPGGDVSISASTEEQRELLFEFLNLLQSATKDGGKKRAAGLKPSWKIDAGHEAAFYRHLDQIEAGEYCSPDSGVPHKISAAWRLLAMAYQEKAGRK